jgi:hypothetical protein
MDDMSNRVRSLERQLLVLHLVAAFAIVVSVASSSIAFSKWRSDNTQMRAREFSLVNASGDVVARLFNAEHGPVLWMQSAGSGSELLLGSQGLTDMGVDVLVDQTPVISMHAGKGADSILSVASEKGHGKARVFLGLSKNEPIMGFMDAEGKIRLTAAASRTPNVTVTDRDGEHRFPPTSAADQSAGSTPHDSLH